MNYKRLLKIMLITAVITAILAGSFLIIFLRGMMVSIFNEKQAHNNYTYVQLSEKSENTNKENVLLVNGISTTTVGQKVAPDISKKNIDSGQTRLGSILANVIIDVPLTPQAPLAEWDDSRQQDGCEEAASLMAVRWARGEALTRAEAKEKILAASQYQSDTYGEYRDTSAADTAKRILKGYYQYEDARVKRDITIEDIIAELRAGHVVIVPMDGQALGNPYYTPPGPERHMLLIRGYDFLTEEFITNDNGTRRGEGYRYARDALFNAIRDYPSGYHAPIEDIAKVMIVVKSVD